MSQSNRPTDQLTDYEKFEASIVKSPSRIVCAACHKGGYLIVGARHFDMVMHNIIAALPVEGRFFADAEQGFIDQHGRFFTREEAFRIARDNGQIRGEPNRPGTLFSEDLY